MSGFTPSPEQAAIIDAPAQADVLVVAGAGSGKTFTMTQRIIALINRGVAPERILGLTFTRKAAGELLERVSAAVSGGMPNGVPGETPDGVSGETANGVRGGASDGVTAGVGGVGASSTVSDRAFLKPAIFTYDAFFQTIVRQYGLLVGFDQNTQPLSEAGALQLATEVIDEHMDLAFSEDFGAFSSLAGRVLALSNAIGSAMIGSGCTGFDDALERVRQWDGGFIDRLQQALEGESVPEDEPKITTAKRAKKDTDADWQAKLAERAKKLHARCVYHCGELLSTTRKREILVKLVEIYAQAKRERNMAEFSDFTIAAYQLIERFPSIGERTRRRYSHVLLDEYQDTSTTQAALLAALFHAEGSERSAVNAVGDPFQSIYAWRGASPGAFRMFQRDFRMPSDAKPFALSVTRRNSRIVLEAANDLTLPLRSRPARPSSSLMHEVEVSSLAHMPDAPEGTLGVLGFATAGQEIDAVVRFCATVVARKRMADDEGGADPGEAQDGGKAPVAVLFRSKTHMPEYQEALERAGLTTFVVGYSALLERPEIRDVLALLHVVADHTDAGALMRLLATPRFNVSAADLTALARIAEDENTRQRFRALVQAGLAQADAPRGDWAAIVREYRNQVANAVFLPDLLLRGDIDDSLVPTGPGSRERQASHAGGLSAHGRNAIVQASAALRRVHNTVGRPLTDVVRAAIEALNLDIDTVVAGALRDPRHRANPTMAHMPMDAIVNLVDSYTQEIAVEQTPTLRGFMAWVDHLSSVEDEAANLPDGPVDVNLMTVHQSKGLEWDAVAVVGLTAGGFPSSQGDQLKVTLDDDHPGGTEQGLWTAPEYHESADSWLTDPTAVPVPVRSDAGILPRFPHDADADADPIEALKALDDVELIDDEAFGSMREFGDGVDEVDPSAWYLTQAEEYGRRLHADERRLAYVALTRAREDALLTYSRYGAEPGRDPQVVKSGSRAAQPSNFWMEVHDALHTREDVATASSCVERLGEHRALTSSQGEPIAPPDGFFTGGHADEYCDAVIGEAWRTPLEQAGDATELPWPATLSEATRERLGRGVKAVRRAMQNARESPDSTDSPDGLAGPLLQRAQLLADDDDLITGTLEGEALDEAIKAKARRILAAGRQNVTSMQARVGGMDEREERDYWRGIVRPIPRIASPAAEAGTRLHDWAERFVNAGKPDEIVLQSGETEGGETPTRETLLADLSEREHLPAAGDGQAEANVLLWQRRLAESTWAERMPAWAERSIVVDVPGVGIVNGKLDAVFVGGLDPSDTAKRLTVVDWKTGRRPTRPDDVERKLAQLDMYRLLLAAVEGIALDSIDATLYYVSEPDEGRRELHARAKTKQEILAELSSGIPEQSDND
jgi:DNA helicase-2/ATP-dependent DNA helicase PcrA